MSCGAGGGDRLLLKVLWRWRCGRRPRSDGQRGGDVARAVAAAAGGGRPGFVRVAPSPPLGAAEPRVERGGCGWGCCGCCQLLRRRHQQRQRLMTRMVVKFQRACHP